MVINKNTWISAATKEPKQNWKIKGLVPGQVKKGEAEQANHWYSTRKLTARYVYNEAGENGLLSAKCMDRSGRKPLKQTASNSPILQGGLAAPQPCITQRQSGKSKPNMLGKVRGWWNRDQNATLGGDPYEQPSLWSWHRGQLEGCSTGSAPAAPMWDPTSCFAHCHPCHQTEGQQLLLFREGNY